MSTLEAGLLDRATALAQAQAAIEAQQDAQAWTLLAAGPLTEGLAHLAPFWRDASPERPLAALLAGLAALERGASEEAEPLLARAAQDGGWLWAPLAHTELARLAMAQRRWGAADEALARARACPAWPGPPADEAWHHLSVATLGRHRGESGWPERLAGGLLAMPTADAGVAHAQVLGHLLLVTQELNFGSPTRALEALGRLDGLAAAWPSAGPPQGPRLRALAKAMALALHGEGEQARRALGQVPQELARPWRWDESLLLGNVKRLLGERAEAFEAHEAAYHTMLARGPGDAPAMGWLAEAMALGHRDQGAFAKALSLHEAAALRLKASPVHVAQCALSWAWTAWAAGDRPLVVQKLAEAQAGLQGELQASLRVRAKLLQAALDLAAGQEAQAQALVTDALLWASAHRRLDGIAEAAELAPDLAPLAQAAGRSAWATWRSAAGTAEQTGGEVRVRLFGKLGVAVDGLEVADWPRKRAKALVALLALHPEGLPREALVARLTPHMDESEALHQLSNAAWGLRRALEPKLGPRQASKHLLSEDGRLRLARVASDHGAFLAAYERGVAARAAGDVAGAEAAFRLALGGVRGPFLPDPWLEEAVRPEAKAFKARFLDAADWLRGQGGGALEAAVEEALRRAGLGP